MSRVIGVVPDPPGNRSRVRGEVLIRTRKPPFSQ
jgi:hypothetical protein